jgi:hypothetical protein
MRRAKFLDGAVEQQLALPHDANAVGDLFRRG